RRTPQQSKLLADNPSVNVTAGSLYLYDHKAASELKALFDRAQVVRATKPKEEFIRALTEVPGQVPATHLFHRGDPGQPRQAVGPGELSILRPGQPIASKDPGSATSGRRLAYALQLTDGSHPLTARVIVNRVWLNHFGRGLVGSPANFGV